MDRCPVIHYTETREAEYEKRKPLDPTDCFDRFSKWVNRIVSSAECNFSDQVKATMNIQKTTLSVLASFVFMTSALAQNIEITPHVGGQINGGLDLSTTIFHRIEVQNGLNYGITAGYLLGDH